MVKFLVAITVEGVPYAAGDLVKENEIPLGCLVSMKRLRQVEVIDPPAADLKVEAGKLKPQK